MPKKQLPLIIGLVCLAHQCQAQLPASYYEKNMISQIYGEVAGFVKTLQTDGLEAAVTQEVSNFETVISTGAKSWYTDTLDFQIDDFRGGMAMGAVFIALEFVFQNYMNTWSWMGYAYTFSLSS